MWRRYDAAGLTSAQACGDSMRNPTACPVDGDDARGYVRVTPLLEEFQTFAMTNERMTAFLPRKWKVVVTGCPTDCAAVKLHCLAFTPARADDGTLGFHAHIGGGLSDTPRIADELDFFVRSDQVTDTVRATLEVYREFGDFDHKAVNRFRVLVHEMGPERVGAEIRQRIGSETAPAGESLWTGEHEDHLGIHEDGRGTHYAGLCIPMGRLTDDEWFEVARLARTHGDGGIQDEPAAEPDAQRDHGRGRAAGRAVPGALPARARPVRAVDHRVHVLAVLQVRDRRHEVERQEAGRAPAGADPP